MFRKTASATYICVVSKKLVGERSLWLALCQWNLWPEITAFSPENLGFVLVGWQNTRSKELLYFLLLSWDNNISFIKSRNDSIVSLSLVEVGEAATRLFVDNSTQARIESPIIIVIRMTLRIKRLMLTWHSLKRSMAVSDALYYPTTIRSFVLLWTVTYFQ